MCAAPGLTAHVLSGIWLVWTVGGGRCTFFGARWRALPSLAIGDMNCLFQMSQCGSNVFGGSWAGEASNLNEAGETGQLITKRRDVSPSHRPKRGSVDVICVFCSGVFQMRHVPSPR